MAIPLPQGVPAVPGSTLTNELKKSAQPTPGHPWVALIGTPLMVLTPVPKKQPPEPGHGPSSGPFAPLGKSIVVVLFCAEHKLAASNSRNKIRFIKKGLMIALS